MAVFAYYRVSTSKQQDSGAGLAAQAREVGKLAKSVGLAIDAEFVDTDCRETSPFDRPGLGALLQAVKRDDTIIVQKFDRLGEILEIGLLLRDLGRRGIEIRAVHGGSRSTPEGELLSNLLLSVSRFELHQIRARTRAALRAKKAQGKVYCARLYGFRAINGRFEADESESSVLSEIADMRSSGTPYRAIADCLNSRGVPAPSGAIWHPMTIRRLAQRARPAGMTAGSV